MDTQPEPELTSPEPEPEPLLPREEFFARLQQELLQNKRTFASFIATAQDGIRRAAAYPLPFPIMEPEFERDEVSKVYVFKETIVLIVVSYLSASFIFIYFINLYLQMFSVLGG